MSDGGPDRPRPSSPRVSVIIPTYNRSRVLAEAIGSVLAQTYQDFEILVVDDGSTDDSDRMILERFGGEPRVRYLRQRNSGPGAARNLGIRSSAGEMIAFLDSDDLWLPEKLRLQVARLDEAPGASFCFCDRVLDERTMAGSRFQAAGFKGDTSLRGIVEKGFPLSTPSIIIRRSVLDEIGLFDESLLRAQDWDLWIRALAKSPATYVDCPLTVVRTQGDSISRTGVLEKWRCWLRLWEKHDGVLRAAGCSAWLLRARRAHAHKKIAQTLRALGNDAAARPHALAWWRCRPWDPRGLLLWARLALRPASGKGGAPESRGSAAPQ